MEALDYLMDGETEDIGYGGAANGGKSWLGCVWLMLMCYKYPGTKWFVGRSKLKDIRDSTLITFYKVLKHYGIPASDWKYNGQDNYLEHKNGSRIDMLEMKFLPSDPLFERFGSKEYTGGWLEEAGEIVHAAYAVMTSRINRQYNTKYNIKAKIFITCNPTKGWLYSGFYKPAKRGELKKGRVFITALVDDNTFREDGAIEKLDNIENKAMRERLRFGNWEYDDAPNLLIQYAWLEDGMAIEKVIGTKVLGVDVARYGDDKTVLTYMEGNHTIERGKFEGLSIDQTADKVELFIKKHGIPHGNVGIDGVGLGAGVVDILRRRGYGVTEIISGASAKDWEYDGFYFQNLRSAMWWLYRESVRNRELSLTYDEMLFEDLSSPTYTYKNDKVIAVESKDDIKKRIGRSTDDGDADVYANYMRIICNQGDSFEVWGEVAL